MSERRSFFNRSSLYIHSGVLRQDQVEAAFANLFARLREAFPNDSDYKKSTAEVNVVCDTKGNLFGVTYAYLNSERVYNILAELNPDGTELVEYYPDPNWKPPTFRPYVPPAKGSKNWGDLMEEEEYEEEQERIRQGLAPTPKPVPQAPMLTRKLDPIARLPEVRYSRDQLLAVARKRREDDLEPYVQTAGKYMGTDVDEKSTHALEIEIAKDLAKGRKEAKAADLAAEAKKVVNALIQINTMKALFAEEEQALNAEFEIVSYKGKELTREDQTRILELQQLVDAYAVRKAEYPTILTDIRRFGALKVLRSFVLTPPEEEDPRQLCCRTAPNWITEDILHIYFDKFNTDPRVYQETVNKVKTNIKYPQIRVTENRAKKDFEGNPQKMVYVTYSRHPDHISDAAFALQMRRKFTIEIPEEKKSAQLIFSHWRISQAQSESGERRSYNRPPPQRTSQQGGRPQSARPAGAPSARPGPPPTAKPGLPLPGAPVTTGRTWRTVAAQKK